MIEKEFRQKDVLIEMVGKENVGKTSILFKLKLGEVIETTSTVVCNAETFKIRGYNLTVRDISYHDKQRPLLKLALGLHRG